MNKVLLVGRLTKDPVVTTTQNGIKNAKFTIAVNRAFNKNEADFVPITCWRQGAEFVEKYIKKGDRVSIEGSFNSNFFEKDGQKNTYYTISADRVQSLNSKNENNQINNTQTQNYNKPNIQEQKVETTKLENNDVPWEMDL